jgi:hypothetical protein
MEDEDDPEGVMACESDWEADAAIDEDEDEGGANKLGALGLLRSLASSSSSSKNCPKMLCLFDRESAPGLESLSRDPQD